MKITKKQLRQIIKEEAETIREETLPSAGHVRMANHYRGSLKGSDYKEDYSDLSNVLAAMLRLLDDTQESMKSLRADVDRLKG